MSDKARVIVIFGVIAALVIGGLYYVFGVYEPGQQRRGAQAEVIAWEARWTEARACLLGATPASSNPREALAIRELAPDLWNGAACSRSIGKLSRGVAEDTGVLGVEHAWMTIDQAAGKVATAFASRVGPTGALPAPGGAPALPAAIAELDAAQAALRVAAGLPPLDGTTGPALRRATEIAIADAGDPVTSVESWMLPSEGGVIGFGRTRARAVELVLLAGAKPQVVRAPSAGVRAVPDGSWGAAVLQREVVIGALDANGGFGTMTHVTTGELARVVMVAGSLADGLVAFGAGDKLGLLHLGAGARTEPPFPVNRVAVGLSPSGRALVAWNTADGALHGLIASAGAPAPPLELGSGSGDHACLTATHGWVGGDPQYMAFDARAAIPHVLPGHELLGCSATAALLHRVDSPSYAVCSESCRVAALANTTSSSVATLVNDRVVAVRARGNVLGLWREGGAPVFVSTAREFTPQLAISDGSVVDVIGSTRDGLMIARVSLR